MVPRLAKSLVDEIFELTGQKLDEGDPLAIAALFQAACISKAGTEAAATLHAAAERLERATEKTRTEGIIAHGRSQELINKVPVLIKTALEMDQRGNGEGLDQARVDRPAGVRRTPWTSCGVLSSVAWFVVGVAFASAAGFMTGYLSASHAQDAAVGRAFSRALPFLRPDDKARLLAEIEKQR